MRVLFTTWGWPSHFYPLVQLGWALGAAGHEVRVATQPGLLPAVGAAGLTPAAVGTDLDVAPLMNGFQDMLRDAGRPLEIDELTTASAPASRTCTSSSPRTCSTTRSTWPAPGGPT